jgi:nucleotide-binding universal stress UspA family protein
METIVVGYDGTDRARSALERAGELARAFDATVLVVAVAEATVTPELPPTDEFLDAAPIELEPIETAEVERELDEAVETLNAGGVRGERVWVVGDPAHAILDVVADRRADLVVVGAGNQGFLSRVFGTAVSDDVVRHAACDVLVVH